MRRCSKTLSLKTVLEHCSLVCEYQNISTNPRSIIMLLRVPVVPICSFLLALSIASPVRHTRRQDPRAATGILRPDFFRAVVDSSDYGTHTKVKTPGGVPLKVGIIGAGAAGLYAAMLLDSLGIDYDIHEGSGRIGGRIYTYRFDQKAWDKATPDEPDYYDYYVSFRAML